MVRFYRKKVILSLLQIFNNSLNNTKFQKYLFLFTQMQKKSSYNFIPYKYGCYSIQAAYDKESLIKSDYLVNDKTSWTCISQEDFIAQLKSEDKYNLNNLKTMFGHYSLNNLIKYIYTNYPYFAINSKIANKYLSWEILQKHKSDNMNKQVFTIGYEGSTIENYLNKLVRNNIKMVVDVRNNPISLKKGFSKKQLIDILRKLQIEYFHLPNLGIPSFLRKKYLKDNDKDYATLFTIYKDTILNDNQRDIKILLNLLEKYKRIALTCFEKDPSFCHRKIVASEIEKQPIHI